MLSLDAPPILRLRRGEFEHVNLTLVGCGGTGSHIAGGLATLLCALAERGISAHLRLIDPDHVELKNVGRQLFATGDVGRPKAEVLAQRLNAAYGLAIAAAVRPVQAADFGTHGDGFRVFIGAVDNPQARRVIDGHFEHGWQTNAWWLDCGNENHSGQVVLGNCGLKKSLQGSVSALGLVDRLPTAAIVAPDLLELPKPAKRRAMSCAELTAAGEQGLMVNRMMAAWALAMLHDLLLGELKYFATWINLDTGGVRTWPIDLPTLSEASGLSHAQLKGETK